MPEDPSVRSRFLERAILAQEEERRRISQELHDDIGQMLASLLVGLRRLEGLLPDGGAPADLARELRHYAGITLEEVGRLARGLRPVVLDQLGLAPAVEHLAAELNRVYGVQVDVHVGAAMQRRRLPPVVEIAVYRVAQEALSNVGRHADALLASVVLDERDECVVLIVEDDGQGLPGPDERRPTRTGGLGLQGMRERAAMLRGEVTIESAPGAGTTVRLMVPLAQRPRRVALIHAGRRVALEPGTYVIGRGAQSDIMLQDLRASRSHARLHVREGGASLEDLGSLNGVRVNGRAITGLVAVHDGDLVECGEDALRVLVDSADPDDWKDDTRPTARPR